MSHYKEFCRHAPNYERYRLIQARVAKALAGQIAGRFDTIIDLGCGSGGFLKVYEQKFMRYLAIDLSPQMLALHPKSEGVEKRIGNFSDPSLFKTLKKESIDLVVSASSLQWSEDLHRTLEGVASLNAPVALAIFTSGTFATIHETAGITSLIRSAEETIEALRDNLEVEVDILRYRLYFEDVLSMLRYIKRSGVSGGKRRIGYKETKMLLECYPLPYLEFEVVQAISPWIKKQLLSNNVRMLNKSMDGRIWAGKRI